MSGLDGLGWPNPEDEPKPKKTMNSRLESKLAPTPETDAENQRIMESWNTYASDHCKMLELAQKLERERDEAREYADKLVAHKDMVCLPKDLEVLREANLGLAMELNEARATCSELVTDSNAITLAQTVVRITQERDELREWASVNGVSSLAKDRDQFRARLREEQQLHVQTLNERDEAQGQLAGIENKMRGELGGHPDSELWGDAGLIAATMRAARVASTLEDVIQKFRDEEEYLLLDKSSRALGGAIAYGAMADELSKLVSLPNAVTHAPGANEKPLK